ncbi:MAG: CHAD domain-containing protein, partial [Chloroflexi bacterium]|nr:CHAD domain-containing protein [Chloroflexota bacterium]
KTILRIYENANIKMSTEPKDLTPKWRFVTISLTFSIITLSAANHSASGAWTSQSSKKKAGMAADDNKRKKQKELLPTDPMAEAGRLIFARQIRRMRSHEAGSRTGADIESVHQMRVAIRRMRSLFNLIGAHYRPKTTARFERGLRQTARALGAIRDLDVLILDLQHYQETLSPDDQARPGQGGHLLGAGGGACRLRLNQLLESKRYARFIRAFQRFAKRPGKGARRLKRSEAPHQLRHVLPLLLHERLARVKAYDTVLPASDDAILHALRVEYKQLRYALEFFQPILGRSAGYFLKQVKEMQELLGRINDIAVFSGYVSRLNQLRPEQSAILKGYVAARKDELVVLRERFYDDWARFNSRAAQRKFSDSLLILR